jgi:adenosylcobinamide-phosphate synthase
MEILLILLLALAIDLALGDPPDTLHPVAWMGKLCSWLEKGCIFRSKLAQFLYGLGMVLFIMMLFSLPVYFLLRYLSDISTIAYVIAGGILLKFTFSFRGLRQAALKIKRLLSTDKLEDARFELRALVSRDTRHLTEPLIVSAAVESVAENASDSFVAPLFYFLLLGVPGALAYRAVNTLDAIIGYHGKYEYLGKFASRLDDVLNFIPSRLSALLIILAAFVTRRSGRKAWQVALAQHRKTESPNAGWPMAAIAGALCVRLEKPGHYEMGEENHQLTPETIDQSLKVMQMAMLLWVLICLTAGGIYVAVAAQA